MSEWAEKFWRIFSNFYQTKFFLIANVWSWVNEIIQVETFLLKLEMKTFWLLRLRLLQVIKKTLRNTLKDFKSFVVKNKLSSKLE